MFTVLFIIIQFQFIKFSIPINFHIEQPKLFILDQLHQIRVIRQQKYNRHFCNNNIKRMSKSEQQLEIGKQKLSSTINSHHRSRSKRFSKGTNIVPVVLKAKQLYQKGQLKESLFYFQEALRAIEGKQKNKEQMNETQILYQMGTISLAIGQYSKAETYFNKVVQVSNNYKGNTLLLLAISLNKLNKSKESLDILDAACRMDKPVDGLFYRGKLRLKNMSYREALEDFSRIIDECKISTIQIRLNLIQAKLYANSDKINTDWSSMLSDINQILHDLLQNEANQLENIRKCRNLKTELLLSHSKLVEAEQQININLSSGKRDSWTLLLKSKLVKQMKNIDQQILLLNECITVKDHKRSVIQALQTLLLHAMAQKDFYEAFQYSKRNAYIKIQHKPTISLFKIAQAVTFLMKKKYGQALLLIGATDPEIYRQIHGDFVFIRNLHYSALGYAYFSLGEHKDALEMYKKIQINEKDEEHTVHLYNRKLCEGILAYKQNKIEESIKIFENSTDHLMRAQPYFYISVILVQKSFSGNTDPELITKVVQIIDSGLKVGENYQMYYYRALLYFYLGMNAEALDDVDKAVEKSEQNVAKFFYLRALIFFQQRNYQSAKAELATCLSIDEKFYNAYLQRAKIKLLSDEIEQAYGDLQNYPLCEDWKPLFFLYQHLFTQILTKRIGQQWVIEMASFQVGRFQDAGPAGKVIMAIVCENYEEVMSLLQDALDINFQIGCLDIDDIYLIKSYCCFKLGLFDKCIQMLEKSEQVLKRHETNFFYGEEDEKKLLAIKVNAIYAFLGSEDIQKSKQLCQSLINDVYQGAVYDQLNKIESHLESLKNNEQKQTTIELFSGNSLLSDYLSQQSIKKLKFKYLLPFPKVRVPEIENVPFEQPLMEFTMKDIDNRAEAPWMNKGEYGVIFTNKIEIFQNLKLYTQTEQNQSNSNKNNKTSKERLKQELQLDAEVLNKLEKLSKNKKPIKSDQGI